MKTVSGDFENFSLGSPTLTLCSICSITLFDGTVYRFTDLDADIKYGGHVYLSQYGFDGSAIQQALGTSGQTQTLSIMLDIAESGAGISRTDILNSRLDFAKVIVSWIDFEFPSRGQVDLYSGFVTEAQFGDFLLCNLSIQSRLNQQQGICSDKFGATCRYDFGDALCGVDIAPTTDMPHVHEVIDLQSFRCTTDETSPPGYYANGSALFVGGRLDGLAFEIADGPRFAGDATHGLITLKVPMPVAPESELVDGTGHGASVTLYGGCDKTVTGGCTYWANVPRFGGEPFIPQTSIIASSPPPVSTPSVGAAIPSASITAPDPIPPRVWPLPGDGALAS